MPTQMKPGDTVAPRTLTTIDGSTVDIPTADQLVHLQFRRFAGCPICHLHLQQVVKRHPEITEHGITEVVVFHSDAELLRSYEADLPFATIADPDKELYREFGVERSLGAVLKPASWRSMIGGLGKGSTLKGALNPSEDHLGKPADLLIDSAGRVIASHYGKHANDQWSVDQMLAHARG